MTTGSTMSCDTGNFASPSSPVPPLPLSAPPASPTPKTSHENDRIRFVLQRFPSKAFKHIRERSASVSAGEMISPEGYEALPSQVQKKYFSPQERIHIVQKAASVKRKKQRSKDMDRRPSTSSDLTPRPKTYLSFRRRSSRTSVVSGRSGQENISDADVQWFHSLPEKIQRQQFSPEERLRFASLAPKPGNGTQPARPVQLDQTQRPSISGGHVRHQQRQDSFVTIRKASQPEADPGRIDDFLSSGTACIHPPSVDTNESDADVSSLPPRKMSSTSSRISTSTQSSRPSIPTVKTQKERHIATRTMVLTPIKLPPPKLSSPISKSSLSPSQPPPPVVRRAASSPRLIQSPTFLDMEPSPELIPSTRTFDLATRRQLREILSSSEKFDAMLRDGFVKSNMEDTWSTGKTAASSLRAPSQPPRRSSDVSFLDDDDDEDDQSIASIRGPATPNSIPSDIEALPEYKSPNTATVIKKFFPPDPLVAPREMTLRLTLTRPDLRDFDGSVTATANATVAPPACTCNVSVFDVAGSVSPTTVMRTAPAPRLKSGAPEVEPETLLYRAQRTAVSGVELDDTDALALEPLLPCCEDTTSTKGGFAFSEGPNSHRQYCLGSLQAESWGDVGDSSHGRGIAQYTHHYHHGLCWKKVVKGLGRKH